MQDLIDTEMAIKVDFDVYQQAVTDKICKDKYSYSAWERSVPTIQVIPTKQVSDDILCTTVQCSMELEIGLGLDHQQSRGWGGDRGRCGALW
ncbi:hypothetical protein CPB97_005984, partial [Podila verticillata]